ADVDIVVTATGWPKTLLHRAEVEVVMGARRNRPLVLVDVSVPRNIDTEVHRVENAYLFNIDDLDAIVCENARNREQDLAECYRIIDSAAVALIEKLNSREHRDHPARFQFPSNWVSHGAAVAGG